MDNDDLGHDKNPAPQTALSKTGVVMARFRATQRRHWESLVGPLLERMLDTYEGAIASLAHSDANVRLVALEVLSHRWIEKPADEFARICEEMAVGDPDVLVRSEALGQLGRSFRNSDDVRIGRLLARVVRNDGEPAQCRRMAYLGLFFLRGLPSPRWLGLQERPPTPLRIPEDVDWSFVESFFVEDRVPFSSPNSIESRLEGLPEQTRGAARLAHLGREAYHRGAYQQAIQHFTASIKADPGLPGVYIMRAHAYLSLGRVDDAIVDFTNAIQLNPASSRAYLGRSDTYRQKGSIELAEQDHRRAMDIESQGGRNTGLDDTPGESDLSS